MWGGEGGKQQTLQFPGRKEKILKNINYKIKPFCTDTNQLHVLALKAILCIISQPSKRDVFFGRLVLSA